MRNSKEIEKMYLIEEIKRKINKVLIINILMRMDPKYKKMGRKIEDGSDGEKNKKKEKKRS